MKWINVSEGCPEKWVDVEIKTNHDILFKGQWTGSNYDFDTYGFPGVLFIPVEWRYLDYSTKEITREEVMKNEQI